MDSSLAKPSITHTLLVLGRSLGAGAFGAVHEARWGNQPCAAKTFFLNQSDFDLQSIQKEVSLLQKLRHRHIVQFYRTHEEYGRIYLLMELAEKGSLSRAISKGDIATDDWTTKMRLAHEIAQGLAFMHQEGFIHRDLKSANVLLTKHMEAKLADFGLAKARTLTGAASKTGGPSGGLRGTLRWIAPELLFADKPAYSAKSDVYALGMVMWELAASCTIPFKGLDNDALVALAVGRGHRERLPGDTPAGYRDFVERCWHQDPSERIGANEVVLVQETAADDSTFDDDLETVDLSICLSDMTLGFSSNDIDKDTLDQTLNPEGDAGYVGHLPPSDDDVVAYFSMSAKQGNRDAQLFLGWMFSHGHGVKKSEKDSLWWYHQAADHGHAIAQLRLGGMAEKGEGVEASDALAIAWYRRSANGGSSRAQFKLGMMHVDGRGVRQDDDEAARWFFMAAEQGHDGAQTMLGNWYSLGRHFIQDDAEAAKWFSKAADRGNGEAQFNLGLMLAQGRGIERDESEALKWFIKTADQQSTAAQCNVGFMYLNGQGAEQSDVEAASWFTKAAVRGDPVAQCNLALMYADGRGVEKNDVEASLWYAMSASQGNMMAQHNLGIRYESGLGVEKDDVEAAKWYTKAMEQGSALAQCSLARMTEFGQGVEKSPVEAFKLYLAAAEQGEADAQRNVGMYDQEQGVEQSDVEASRWNPQAADPGYAIAQLNVGMAYEFGNGVEQNYPEAAKWVTKAAKRGFASALNYLGRLYDLGIGVDQNDRLAFLWYSRGAAQQDINSQYNLASLYELGLGVDPNREEALRLFREARRQGDLLSPFHIEWLTSGDYLEGRDRFGASDVVSICLRGAEQGYAAAQHGLARLYEKGVGVPMDAKEALVWYSKAAAQGHMFAEYRMKVLSGTED